MSGLSQVNSEFNEMVLATNHALRGNMLTLLSERDLSNLRTSCKVFWELIEGDVGEGKSKDRLDLHRWASGQVVYINRGFLSPSDFNLPGPNKGFTLQTVLQVAKWLKQNGNTPIPPHALGNFQPRALLPVDYIRGMNEPNADGIYFQLWKVHQEPMGIHNQYGEKAFFDEDDLTSTADEKALACVKFVRTELNQNQGL